MESNSERVVPMVGVLPDFESVLEEAEIANPCSACAGGFCQRSPACPCPRDGEHTLRGGGRVDCDVAAGDYTFYFPGVPAQECPDCGATAVPHEVREILEAAVIRYLRDVAHVTVESATTVPLAA